MSAYETTVTGATTNFAICDDWCLLRGFNLVHVYGISVSDRFLRVRFKLKQISGFHEVEL